MQELRDMNQQMKAPHIPSLATPQQQQQQTLQNTIDETKLGQSSLRKRIEMSGRLLGLDFVPLGTVESTREEPVQRRRSSINAADGLPQRPFTSHGGGTPTKVLPALSEASKPSRHSTLFKGGDEPPDGTPETALRIEISTPVIRGDSRGRGRRGGGGSGVRQSFQTKILSQTEKRCSHLSSFERLESSLNKSEEDDLAPPRSAVAFASVEEKDRRRGQTIAEIRKRFKLETPVLLSQTPGPGPGPASATDLSRFESDQGLSASFSQSETPQLSATNTARRPFIRQLSSANTDPSGGEVSSGQGGTEHGGEVA
jgi:hypothetical protein